MNCCVVIALLHVSNHCWATIKWGTAHLGKSPLMLLLLRKCSAFIPILYMFNLIHLSVVFSNFTHQSFRATVTCSRSHGTVLMLFIDAKRVKPLHPPSVVLLGYPPPLWLQSDLLLGIHQDSVWTMFMWLRHHANEPIKYATKTVVLLLYTVYLYYCI